MKLAYVVNDLPIIVPLCFLLLPRLQSRVPKLHTYKHVTNVCSTPLSSRLLQIGAKGRHNFPSHGCLQALKEYDESHLPYEQCIKSLAWIEIITNKIKNTMSTLESQVRRQPKHSCRRDVAPLGVGGRGALTHCVGIAVGLMSLDTEARAAMQCS
jgi:hypothetical protein